MNLNCPTQVTIACNPGKHFFEASSNTEGRLTISGIEGRLLDIISRTLKFHMKLINPSDHKSGQLGPGGNWTGVIGMVQRGEADIGANFLAITEERTSVVDFTTVYIIDDVTFTIGKPGPLPPALSYLYPFVPGLWASFIILLLIMPLVFLSSTSAKSYFQLLLQLFGSFVTQSLSIKDNSMRSRILQASWIIFTYVISLSYSAVLLSFVSVPLQKEQVKNFLELSNAVREGGMKSYAIFGSVVESFLLNSPQDHLKFLGDTIKREAWYNKGNELDESLINERSALICPRVVQKILYGSHSTKIISEDNLVSWNIAFAVKKDFCYKKSLDAVLSRLRHAGLFEKFVSDESFYIFLQTLDEVSENEEEKQIDIEDIFGAIFVLLTGYALSFLALLIEIIYKYPFHKFCIH
ncbi:glutamate receptor ionotropic, delta-2 [Caerostris darwini]|uniref:Glutamate receptor ionotropic, delta-2 n=1 Tax=Caerostris darwini TaxID=1538125 RepID=A0AAV4UUQ0_9ARAC|nr:glutamate receptor ionotropic, delta-2 [Caerostris darwini]